MNAQHLSNLVRRTSEASGLDGELRAEVASAIAWLSGHQRPDLSYWRGVLVYEHHAALGVADTSIADFLEALEYEEGDIDARYMLACALFDAARFAEAIPHLLMALADPRLRTERNTWRRLKGRELLSVSEVECGRVDLEPAVDAWYGAFSAAAEEDRPIPVEMRRLLAGRGVDPKERWPLVT